MATYLPGLTDFIPQIQPFQPDLNFYANALQVKQGQYDAAHKQISSMYGSLLNAPMLRDVNIQRRDEFFRVIDNDLKKLSGMDLSQPENIQTATELFKPFYEDDNMVKDMTWTRQFQKELQRADNFRACIDPAKCGGQYWEGGVRALHYKADEFRKVSDQEALGFQGPRFTPFVNVTEKAMKAAKEAGFNIKIDQVKGGYIVTTKNGQLLEAPLESFFTSMFGSDQAVTEMFKTQAYLTRKDYVASNAAVYGSEAAAEEAYIRAFMMAGAPQQLAQKQETSRVYDSLLARKQALDARITEEGMILNSQEHREYMDLQSQLNASQQALGFHEQSANMLQSTGESQNIDMFRGRIDDLVAMGMFSNEMKNAAHTFAYKDYEVSMQADPYALAAYSSKLSLQNSLTLKEADYQYWMRKESFKIDQERKFRTGASELNTPTYDQGAAGAATKVTTSSLKENISEKNRLYGEYRDAKQDFVVKLANTLQTQYAAAETAEERKSVRESAQAIFSGTGVDVSSILEGDAVASVMSIHRGIVKKDALNKTLASKDSFDNIDDVYERALKVGNPDEPIWGATTKSWSSAFWEETEGQREKIKNQKMIIGEYGKFYKQQSGTVLDRLRGSTYGDKPADQEKLGYLLDAGGRVRSKEEFALAYAKENESKFEPTITYATPSGQVTMAAKRTAKGYEPINNLGNSGGILETGRDKAYRAASARYDEYVKNYESTYKEHAQPYNGTAALGNSGGGKATTAFSYTVDPYYYESQGALHASSVFKNFEVTQSDPGTKVFFGRADQETPEDDPKARALLNQLLLDFKAPQDKPEKDRPVFKMSYQNVAGYSDKQVGVTIYPSQEWIDKHKGTEKSPGVTGGQDWKNGVTFYIPAAQANNSLREATKFNEYDFIMEQNGKLVMDSYPSAGNIKLTKQGSNYYATGTLKGYDNQGNPVTQTVNEQYQMSLNPSVIYSQWTTMLKDLSNMNKAQETLIRNKYGIKNPAALTQ